MKSMSSGREWCVYGQKVTSLNALLNKGVEVAAEYFKLANQPTYPPRGGVGRDQALPRVPGFTPPKEQSFRMKDVTQNN